MKYTLTAKDNKAIKYIIDRRFASCWVLCTREINNDTYYYKIFNHFNQKYTLEELLKCVIIILKLGKNQNQRF